LIIYQLKTKLTTIAPHQATIYLLVTSKLHSYFTSLSDFYLDTFKTIIFINGFLLKILQTNRCIHVLCVSLG